MSLLNIQGDTDLLASLAKEYVELKGSGTNIDYGKWIRQRLKEAKNRDAPARNKANEKPSLRNDVMPWKHLDRRAITAAVARPDVFTPSHYGASKQAEKHFSESTKSVESDQKSQLTNYNPQIFKPFPVGRQGTRRRTELVFEKKSTSADGSKLESRSHLQPARLGMLRLLAFISLWVSTSIEELDVNSCSMSLPTWSSLLSDIVSCIELPCGMHSEIYFALT